ncbi:MAG: hypothetical protein KDH08_18590 [Anaerolineae bacterium]|nr:hypothetical protein [Anaerolineae bacterium]
MSKIVRRRKGGIRISSKGKISYSPGSVRIGGKSGGINFSKRGVSSSVRVPGGSYNTRTGCRMSMFVLALAVACSATVVAAGFVCLIT